MEILRCQDIAPYTTFGIHATAAAVACYHNLKEFLKIMTDASLPRPFLPIGGGSNMLFTADFPGTVIVNKMQTMFAGKRLGDKVISVGAGCSLDAVCAYTCAQGWWGMANLSGIPGTIGGAVVQNAGAYGADMSAVVRSVSAIDIIDHNAVTFDAKELQMGYRSSIFKRPENAGRYIIDTVYIDLSQCSDCSVAYPHLLDKARALAGGSAPTPAQVRQAVLLMRDEKLPPVHQYGSAGSFFTNPVVSQQTYQRICQQNPGIDVPAYPAADGHVKLSAAWLIDKAGMKGRQVGGAAVWHKQPLVIVNLTGAATAADVLALESEILGSVHRHFGVELKPEVIHVP